MPRRRRGGQAALPGRVGLLREEERHLHHEHRVLQVGDGAGRRVPAAATVDRVVTCGRLLEFGGASRRTGASLMLGRGEEQGAGGVAVAVPRPEYFS